MEPIYELQPCWSLLRLPITADGIKSVEKEWQEASNGRILPYGLYVPAIATFQARKICAGTNLYFDVIPFWNTEYLVVNLIAFKLLEPFARQAFRNHPRPVMGDNLP